MLFNNIKNLSKTINYKSLLIYNLTINNIFSMENNKIFTDFKGSILDNQDYIKIDNNNISNKKKNCFFSFITKKETEEIIFCKEKIIENEIKTKKTLLIQNSLNHPNISKLLSVITRYDNKMNKKRYYILTNFSKNGDLNDFIGDFKNNIKVHNNKLNTLNEKIENKDDEYNKKINELNENFKIKNDEYKEKLNKYTYQIINAIHICHLNNIIHRDIKPENFIVNDEDNIELIDFDYSTKNIKDNKYLATFNYTSPEMIFTESIKTRQDILTNLENYNENIFDHMKNNNYGKINENDKKESYFYYCKANDMYCLGTTLFRLYYGKYIRYQEKFKMFFDEKSQNKIFENTFYGPTELKESVDECIKNLLVPEKDRWTIENVINSNLYYKLKNINEIPIE